MENNENEMKPQTGGLKLMTVFVFVLALHVVVIGGMTAYYVFRSGSTETESLADKSSGIKSENLPGESTTPEVADKNPGVFTITQETLAAAQGNPPATTPVASESTTSTAATEPASVPTPAAPVEQPLVSAETIAPAVTPEAAVVSAPVTEPVSNEVATTETIPAPAPPTIPVTPIEFTPPPAPVVASTPAVTNGTPAVASVPAVEIPAPVVTPTPANLLPPPEAPRLVANASKSTLSIPEPTVVAPTPAVTPAPVTVKPTAPEVAKTASATASKFVTIPVTKLETTTKAVTKKVTTEKASAEKNTYTVKAHDSLEKIAHKNDTTVAKLRAANSLNSDFLSIGQKLIIPAKSHNTAIVSTTPKAVKTVEKTIAKTAEKTAKTATTTAKTTVAKATAKTTPVVTTAAKAKSYTVVKGDTLVKIARDYKTTPKALMAANGISDPTKLSIGKQLKIPAATKTASTKLKTPQLANNEQ